MTKGRLTEKLIMLACCAVIWVLGAQAAPRIPKERVTQPLEQSDHVPQVNPRSDGSSSSGSTGDMDSDITSLMKQQKCGVVDEVESGTGSRSKRWVPLGGRWIKRNLTYRITKHSGKLLARNCVYNKIAKAFAMWTKYVDLSFELVSSEKADIEISFERGAHGDRYPFDGPGNDLAHAFSPGSGQGGDIHFDEDDEWDLEKFYHVAVHEIGHALGLQHTEVPGSAMLAFYPTNAVKELGEDDITGIQARYGKRRTKQDPAVVCTDSSVDAVFNSPDDHIYAFKGKHYWKVTKKGNAQGNPKLISSKWKELPSDIDAALTYNSKTYFFKGSTVWTYMGNKMIRGPRRINTVFSGIPGDINAATIWSGDGNIYFFKGSKYWRYHLKRYQHVSRHYPRPITDWRGLPMKLDAAISFDDNTYFFKGENTYRFDDKTFLVDSTSPQRMKLDLCGC